jgi:hypothetical protein
VKAVTKAENGGYANRETALMFPIVSFVAAMHLPMRYVLREIPANGDKPAIKTSAFETIGGGEKWAR